MSRISGIIPDNEWVVSKRSQKNDVDPSRPYALNIEPEYSHDGRVVAVGTIFITNSECPFKCLMCDLWKNTTDAPSRPGAIPAQIALALESMPPVQQVKLYNSGNFFDQRAIPAGDHHAIAGLLAGMENVVIECHPSLIDDRCLVFRELIGGDLEVAVGLETVDPGALPRLNKNMTLELFEEKVRFLVDNGIRVRAFILLRAPFQSEEEGIYWAKKSIEFAFETGVNCCVVIPTRTGNGAMEWLQAEGHFNPPALDSLEEVIDHGIGLNRGRVFADLWDLEKFSDCDLCFESRKNRLNSINLHQKHFPPVSCGHGT